MNKLINNYLYNIQESVQLDEGFLAAIGTVYSATMIVKYAMDLGNKYLTKAGRECNHLTGASQNLCIVDFRIRALVMQLNELKKNRRLCSKTRNPKACTIKLNNKINILEQKLRDLYNHKKIFEIKAREEKRQSTNMMSN